MRRTLTLLAMALLMGFTAGRAQQSQGPALVFRTDVARVRVDVVVTDSSDRPVTGLTKDDFTIVENGRPQAITDFQYVDVPVAHRDVDRAAVAAAPPADVATNAAPSANSRIWAIVVDDLHLIEQDLVPTKRVLTDIVQSIPADDEVAIVYVSRSDLSQNFTTNTDLLMKSIDHLRDALGFGFDALPGGNGLDPTGTLSGARATREMVYAQARTASDVLRYVARALEGSEHERRAIIYVGSMTTIDSKQPDGVAYFLELQRAFDEAKRADVPIYTVDPRGNVGVEDSLRHGIGEIPDAATRAMVMGNIMKQWDWLSTIAVNTGGRAFFHEADLGKAVHDLVEDNSSFYLLSYSPDPFPHDGKFHDITVKVNRPGVHVRARQGYVAPGAAADTATLETQANDAMAKGVDVSGLTLHAWAAPLAAGSRGMKTPVIVEVTYPAGSAQRISDHLQMNVVALDPDGHEQASSAHALTFEGTAPPSGDVTFDVDDVVDLPSKPLTLRIAVASQSLARAGSIQLQVDVPKPTDGDLQMSGVALDAVDEHPEPALRANALSGVVPFQPTTTRTFAAAERLRLFGHVFWKSGAGTPDVTITITGAGTPRAPRTVAVGGTSIAHNRAQGVLDATVPLAGLAPGDYVIEIAAQLGRDHPVVRQIPITVK